MVEQGDIRVMRNGDLARVREIKQEFSPYWRHDVFVAVIELVDEPRVTFTRALGTVDGWPLRDSINP